MINLIKLNTAIKDYKIINRKIKECENAGKIKLMEKYEDDIFPIIKKIDDIRRLTGISQEKIMEKIGE